MARRRRRGEGSVSYDRTAKAWVARVSLGVRDGKRIRHKLSAPTEQGAKDQLERLQRAYAAGAEPATMTLDEYLEGWLADHSHTIRPSTHRSYAGHIRVHIAPLLGGIIVAKLRPADVRRLIAVTLASGRSPSTVGRIIATLHVALAELVEERALTDNPASVKLPRVEHVPVRGMTAAEAVILSEAIRGDQFESLYRLLMGSGIRVGEATGLDWRDIHLAERFVIVRRSKTRARAVPISADAAAALAGMPAGLPDRPVFLGPRTGERLDGSTVLHAFHRLLAAKGLRPMRVHDLRHAVATLMLAAGTPMRVISEQLGHSNPAMTARTYAHVVPESQRAALDALDRAMGPVNGSRTA